MIRNPDNSKIMLCIFKILLFEKALDKDVNFFVKERNFCEMSLATRS